MLDAISIFERLRNAYKEVEAFNVPLSEIYTTECSPGKQIDLANTIYECVLKNAWSKLPSKLSDDKIEKAPLSKLIINAKPFFERNDYDFYEEAYNALTAPAGRLHGNRNQKGDISHGHLHSKVELCRPHAALSLNLALSFAAYFFMILDVSESSMKYDDHSDQNGFNEWLNERGDKIGGASYSWLLFNHDYNAYENYYDEYQMESADSK